VVLVLFISSPPPSLSPGLLHLRIHLGEIGLADYSDIYEFDTFDMTSLPDSLVTLGISYFTYPFSRRENRSSIRLVGHPPAALQTLTLFGDAVQAGSVVLREGAALERRRDDEDEYTAWEYREM
jgi:hypothetical protein